GGPYPNEASSGFIKDLVISNHELSATDILNDYSNFCPTVLPIDWKFVQGEPTQEGNLLQWQVNFPEFINYFEIERKKAEGDFSSIGNIDGGTNYSEDFFFLDQQPDENIAYYRIKAVDLDGNISFSKLIELTSDMPYKLYPNPAKDFIWVNVSDDTQRNYLEIYSVDGRKWKTVELKHNHNKISISDLPDGVFILKMNGKTPLRIVKTR
ncbi:MAG: T9SS type A sorting domain-containing protein, partial [Bacteroidetes bacterium]|nr:T9SS type A sorting domain-containing protein [Bacteroidota bacterium]